MLSLFLCQICDRCQVVIVHVFLLPGMAILPTAISTSFAPTVIPCLCSSFLFLLRFSLPFCRPWFGSFLKGIYLFDTAYYSLCTMWYILHELPFVNLILPRCNNIHERCWFSCMNIRCYLLCVGIQSTRNLNVMSYCLSSDFLLWITRYIQH